LSLFPALIGLSTRNQLQKALLQEAL
jgi:hypothetical protein